MIGLLKPDKAYSPIFLIIAVLICFSLSTGVRLKQYSTWKQSPEAHFVKDIPMMTTLDAYLWTKQARQYKDGTVKELPDRAIVFLLAKLSAFFDDNVYKTGIYMIPVISSLFVIPLCIYFFNLNLPACGVLGSLVGTFSYIYMARSCIGRVRNDSMHLVFLFLASLFILNTRGKDRRTTLIYSGLAGLVLALFYWWYGNPVFNGVYLVTLVFFLIINKTDRKTVLLSTLVFALFSNPLVLWMLLANSGHYFFYFMRYFTLAVADRATGAIAFPDVLQTITETQHTPLAEMLGMIISQPFISYFGITVFIALTSLYWRSFIPLIPPLLLAYMAFKSSNRFAMYLAPFVGIGLGYFIDILIAFFIGRSGIAAKRTFIKDIAVYAVSFLFFFLISTKTGISFIPTPSVPPIMYSTLEDIKTKIPEKSVLYTWWDYGYVIQDVVGAEVFHDGGQHGGDRTYFVAKGLVTENDTDLYHTALCLDSVDGLCLKKVGGIIDDNKTPDEMLGYVNGFSGATTHKDIFVLFTYDMIGKYASIYFLGGWNFGSRSGGYDGYQQLLCQGMNGDLLQCDPNIFDLKKGLIDGRPGLKKVVVSDNGRLVAETSFPNMDGPDLELIRYNNQVVGVYVMSDRVFNSNFNRMYLLGQYDKNLYDEVYNRFPLARMFRLKR
jgi:dolichyl-diphosphooligosaccharide--protein glycosyltransferase